MQSSFAPTWPVDTARRCRRWNGTTPQISTNLRATRISSPTSCDIVTGLPSNAELTQRPSSFLKSPKAVEIVAAAFGGGQRIPGVDEGPQRLIEEANLTGHLQELGWDVQFSGNYLTAPVGPEHNVGRLRNARSVSQASHQVAKAVQAAASKGHFALTLGGDNSVTIGSIAGAASVYRDLAVIYVDAHADINTPDTTQSGNMHGMPNSFLFGLADDVEEFKWVKDMCGGAPPVSPRNFIYVGLQDLDPAEKMIVRDLGIPAFTMHEIDRHGIGGVLQRALDMLAPRRGRPIHLMFDIDVLDPMVMPSTGILTPGGLTLREARYICREVARSGMLVSMDLVEFNPLRGDPLQVEQSMDVVCSLVKAALGETYV